MKEITIPKKLVPLVKAFSVDDQSAKLLISEAAKAIGKAEDNPYDSFDNKGLSNEELDGVVALMKGLDPKDTMEMLYAAQIVSSHLMGLRFLNHSHPADQTLGLKLLRFSNEAMDQLLKKRAGGVNQHINITYNHVGGSSTIQNVIKKD